MTPEPLDFPKAHDLAMSYGAWISKRESRIHPPARQLQILLARGYRRAVAQKNEGDAQSMLAHITDKRRAFAGRPSNAALGAPDVPRVRFLGCVLPEDVARKNARRLERLKAEVRRICAALRSGNDGPLKAATLDPDDKES